jgi:8-oxo-dGTP pyrophosphatase MutT (NUDIX family)
LSVINERLPQWLATRLAQSLPGPMVGSRFEPGPRPWRHYEAAPANAREAAVLVLLYPHQGQWHLPLTLRPEHLAAHAGQVSLPGGAVEPGETTAVAALREFHEELGDDSQAIEMLGRLSPLYVQASNFLVTPWVASARRRPRFLANPAEVAEVLEVPLADLCDPGHFGSHERQQPDGVFTAPHFIFQSHRIWGATCMILGELVTVLAEMGMVDG